MDPLSATASIIAIIQLSSVIIGYLSDVKDASKDRERCAIEVSNVSNLLVSLRFRLDGASSNDGWYTEVQALAVADGPIDQYKSALEQLQSKLTSTATSALKKIGSALTWTFSKEEVINILARIERLKSLTQIALEMDHFKLSQALKNDTTVITTTVRSLQESQDSQRYRVITDWLSSTDFPAEQSDFIGKRQERTGLWFVVSPEFTNWLQGTKQILFCPGIPGAGKTMIAAIAVDHVWKAFQNDNVGVAYIYCNYKRQEDQTTTKLLAAILKQLVQERPLYGEPVAALHNLHADRRTHPSLDEICTALNSVISNYSKVYIIIDALDECTDRDGTRSQLLTILRNLQTKTDTSLMATSRFDANIEQFNGFPKLEIRANDADIKRFVAGRIHRLPKFVQRDLELQTEIKDEIALVVDGMFLLARLHVDSLRGKKSKKVIKSTLERLPKGSTALKEAYDEAFERINGQLPEESELAKSVLSWITNAKRQLTTKELSHALAVEAGESELDEDNIPDIDDMISVCAGLVAVDEESDIIRLVHYTTQEYFEGVLRNPEAQEEIASTCLTYLSFHTFDTGHCHSDEDFERRMTQNPFLDYAAQYWGDHALPVQEKIEKLALLFLHNRNQVSCSNQVATVSAYRGVGYSQEVATDVTGIHLAVNFGMVYLLQKLMGGDGNENCMYIDAPNSYGQTPLRIAAERGHEEIVKLLLARGDVKADAKNYLGQTALWAAAWSGKGAVVKLLVTRDDVKADAKDKSGRTPLWMAALMGCEEVVKLLLARGDVEADVKDKYKQTPLWTAAKFGREAVVKLLVARDDVDVNAKDEDGRTPLWMAAANGHEAVVKLLVGRDDVEVNVKDKDGWTPLWMAAANGDDEVVKLLFTRDDIEADAKNKRGRTPLWVTAASGHEAVVKLLIARDDVDVNAKDEDGRTPLWMAAANGDDEVVKLLFARDDIEANAKDGDGRTPLCVAAANGHEAVVKLLVARDDVEVNAKDDAGRTPLLIAETNGNEAVVKLLRSHIEGRHRVEVLYL